MMKTEKKWLLEKVQKDLWKCDFWKPTFFNVLYRHSYQNEFYLLGSEPTPQFVERYLHNVLRKIQGKHEVACRRVTAKDFVELNLGISYVSSHSRKRQMTTVSELVVYIDDDQITVSLLPYGRSRTDSRMISRRRFMCSSSGSMRRTAFGPSPSYVPQLTVRRPFESRCPYKLKSSQPDLT